MGLIWFGIIAGVGTFVLIVANSLRLRWYWGAGLSIAISIALASVLAFGSPVTLGRERWFEISPVREMLLFVLMLLGMVARVVSAAIERQRSSDGTAAQPHVSRWDFVYPLLFSIPTFGALLSQTNSQELTTPVVVLAFQTGFFWQTILKAAEPR